MVRKTSSKADSEKKGTTIAVPPAEINITYEIDFTSEPLWAIKKLGFWKKEKKGELGKKDFQKSLIAGAFTEIDSLESENGTKYVLIEHEKQEKWICAGKTKSGQKCEFDREKKKCKCNYLLSYQNLKNEYALFLGPQYGIKGSAEVKYDSKTLNLKLIAVTYKTHQNGDKSTLFTQIKPGRYKGIVLARGRYVKKYKDKALMKSLSIWFQKQWDDDTGKWYDGVIKGKDKNGKPISAPTSCFIHPAHYPWQLDGCLALGYTHSDYGFESNDDTKKAMTDLFKLIGISTEQQFKKAQELGHKEPFIITITDKRAHTLILKVEQLHG